MTEESGKSIAFLAASLAQDYFEGPFIVIVRNREEFSRWLGDAVPGGVEGLEVHDLIGDSEAWGMAAQGRVPLPVDVVLNDPPAEFSALYRLVDVSIARPVRITVPAKPGFMKALRMAAALRLPVRLLPGQPGGEVLSELMEAAHFYLHDPMVEAPIEFFHSVLASFRGLGAGTLWSFLEQDPAIFSRRDATGRALQAPDFVETHLERLLNDGAECGPCPWQQICAGYFKWPDSGYDCAGVKQLFATLQSAADEITLDLAAGEILPPP